MRAARLLTVAIVCVAAAAPAARAQDGDPFAGKTVDELIALVKKRMDSSSNEANTAAAWEEFESEQRRRYATRLAGALRVWKQLTVDPRERMGQLIDVGRVYRSYGLLKDAERHFLRAKSKSNDGWTQRRAYLELARLWRLRGNESKMREHLLRATKAMKGVKMGDEAGHLTEVGAKLKRTGDLRADRGKDPTNWRTQWALCDHLLRFKDPRGMPYLLLDTLVELEWMRTRFANEMVVTAGGIDWQIVEASASAYEFETMLEAADRLFTKSENARVKRGDLVHTLARVLRVDETHRQQALHCYQYLQAQHPNHPAVTSQEVDKDIRSLRNQKGVRREPAGTPIPVPPWKP